MSKSVVMISPKSEVEQRSVRQPALPKMAVALCKPFARLLAQKKSIPSLFCELVSKLSKWFSITKATLAVHHHQTGTLKLASWWDQYCFKQGVLMSLPTENSLFYRVLESRRLLHEPINGNFPGNYIERRLMVSKTTAALAVYPLVFNNVVQGVISIASPVPYAFEMLEEGYLDAAFEQMANVLAERSSEELWESFSEGYCEKRDRKLSRQYVSEREVHVE